MARSSPEWIGKTPGSKIPDRVRTRVFDRAGGICHLCKLPIEGAKSWDADHQIALINGGENRETNLGPAHKRCHKAKTKADVAEKAKVAAMRRKNDGRVRAPSKLKSRNDFPKAAKVKPQGKQSLPPKMLFARSRGFASTRTYEDTP